MWEYEYGLDTDLDREALWRCWADMGSWPAWNGGIARMDVDGPFAVGTTFTMVPPAGDPVPMRLVEIEPGRLFVDEMDDGETRVTTVHRLDPAPDGRTRVTYRTSITGPVADELGPQITADFPDVVAALVRRAGGRAPDPPG